MTGDISAFLFDPRQAYTSVRLQQGRVITDLDWNENERIDADRRRRLLADLVCGHGSTNQGFAPVSATFANAEIGGDAGVQTIETYNVTFSSGSFLLGGELHRWPDADVETFLAQPDWLQQTGADSDAIPSRPTTPRTDLAYLEAFERPVTAAEDRELRERALGGPDTSTRMRAFRRVRILEDAPADCSEAAAALQALVTAPALGDASSQSHGFDPVTCEVLSKTRLTIDFSGPGPTGDLCQPRVLQGYLGAENQAIRVQLTQADRFVWAYDNAAPLYRVQVSDSTPAPDGSIEIAFLTQPKDPELFPLNDMVAELLPWDAVLANQEKTAATSGHLARVTAAYDPGAATMRITPPAPGALESWLGSTARDPILSPRDPADEQRFYFLRIWRPGPAGGADLDHTFTPGAALDLPDTGLSVIFSDFGLPGDYWIAAARPNTPDLVAPWRLLDAAAPFGPKRFYAPLGLLTWQAGVDGEFVAESRDCRHRFRKLCDVESCCTVHVGDGDRSVGDVRDLQAAIDLLPPEGGRVCLLPGAHAASASLDGQVDVVIQGCGPDSVLVPAPGQTAPLITIFGGARLTLRDFATASADAQHIVADRAREVTLEGLTMRARDRGAVAATRMRGMRIERCRIHTETLEATRIGQGLAIEPAVFLAGARLVMRDCEILTESKLPMLTAHGGLQIGGDSIDIEIHGNLIRGGNGPGIMLGSIDFQQAEILRDPIRLREHYRTRASAPNYASWLVQTDDGCINIGPRPNPGGGDDDVGEPLTPVSDGPIEDCRILDNRIFDMGASGVTVAFWFDPDEEEDAIVTDRLRIESNEIRRCMRLPTTALSDAFLQIAAFGGVTLAVGSDIVIRENLIADLANDHPSPIVGVFALDVSAIEIQGNHIRDNGQIATLSSAIALGLAGGVMLTMVRPGFDLVASVFDQKQPQARQDGAAACVVENNTIVAREGRALTVIGVGPMMIHGNRLTAHGSNSLSRFPFVGAVAGAYNLNALAAIGLLNVRQLRNPLLALLDVLGGAAVAVLNLGLSNEVYLQLLGFSGLGLVDPPQQANDAGFDDDIKLLANGNVLFNDNQVTLDSVSSAVTLTLSSTFLLSLDDIAFENNQLDCDMGLDFVAINTVAIGWSVRAQGNRFKEGLFNAFLSAMTVGLMNDTSHNQGTHCFSVLGGFQPRILNAGANAELDSNRHLIPEKLCEAFGGNAFGRLAGGFAIKPQAAAFGQLS